MTHNILVMTPDSIIKLMIPKIEVADYGPEEGSSSHSAHKEQGCPTVDTNDHNNNKQVMWVCSNSQDNDTPLVSPVIVDTITLMKSPTSSSERNGEYCRESVNSREISRSM